MVRLEKQASAWLLVMDEEHPSYFGAGKRRELLFRRTDLGEIEIAWIRLSNGWSHTPGGWQCTYCLSVRVTGKSKTHQTRVDGLGAGFSRVNSRLRSLGWQLPGPAVPRLLEAQRLAEDGNLPRRATGPRHLGTGVPKVPPLPFTPRVVECPPEERSADPTRVTVVSLYDATSTASPVGVPVAGPWREDERGGNATHMRRWQRAEVGDVRARIAVREQLPIPADYQCRASFQRRWQPGVLWDVHVPGRRPRVDVPAGSVEEAMAAADAFARSKGAVLRDTMPEDIKPLQKAEKPDPPPNPAASVFRRIFESPETDVWELDDALERIGLPRVLAAVRTTTEGLQVVDGNEAAETQERTGAGERAAFRELLGCYLRLDSEGRAAVLGYASRLLQK
jgi:hypothetical protein